MSADQVIEAAARRTERVSELVAAIEDIITDQTGQNVLRSGWDGSFTANGGTVARMIDAALEAAAPDMLAGVEVATEEELDALPVGTVVLSDSYRYMVHGGADCGWPVSFQRWRGGDWHRGGRSASTHPDNFLPVTILYRPTP